MNEQFTSREVFLPFLAGTASDVRQIAQEIDWSDSEIETVNDFADFVEAEARTSGLKESDIIFMYFDKKRQGLSLELVDG